MFIQGNYLTANKQDINGVYIHLFHVLSIHLKLLFQLNQMTYALVFQDIAIPFWLNFSVENGNSTCEKIKNI